MKTFIRLYIRLFVIFNEEIISGREKVTEQVRSEYCGGVAK